MNLHHHDGSCGHSCCLRVENLSVNIGADSILSDINLHIHCGEMVALIGPNGAGKSTFLKAVLGQREYSGVIAFSEPGQRSKKPRIGYVPQSPAFDPSDPISVSDLFACCMSKRPAFLGLGGAMEKTVLNCLERVHGQDLIHKRVGTLSGVDVEGMETLMDMLDEIRREYDLSILMTTHDFSLLPRYADQVVLIDRTVRRQGKPAEVLDSPEFHQVFHMRGGSV